MSADAAPVNVFVVEVWMESEVTDCYGPFKSHGAALQFARRCGRDDDVTRWHIHEVKAPDAF